MVKIMLELVVQVVEETQEIMAALEHQGKEMQVELEQPRLITWVAVAAAQVLLVVMHQA